MKKSILLLFGFLFLRLSAQIPSYYSPVNFDLTGLALKAELSDLITSTHTSPTSYSEVWDVLKVADLDPENDDVVLLIYGYNDADGDNETDRTRDKHANGGSPPGEWNREHVFPKSLGSPDLGTTGPGSDPHHLRAADIDANGHRSNRKFANGAGNAGTVGANWFPGEEWKGDVARMLMYMYVRYNSRCLPNAVTIGTSNAIDANMIDLLLEWHAADEVSPFELNRNNVIYEEIGNRNPFIDNPAIANRIWGGPETEDTWGVLSVENFSTSTLKINLYPNPTESGEINLAIPTSQTINKIIMYSLDGRQIIQAKPALATNQYALDVKDIPSGLYLIELEVLGQLHIRKICIQ